MRHLIEDSLCAIMMTMTLAVMTLAVPARAAELAVTMRKVTPDGLGETLGTITAGDSDAGVVFKLALHGLPPGPHGFHVHANANCGPTALNGVGVPGGAAGGHLDPGHTEKHEGPAGEGHLGDLPALDVATDGSAMQTLTAPRIKDVSMLKGHALMIHMGGDNYKDTPAPLGGGGARLACGVIE